MIGEPLPESLLAVTGIREILADSPPRITQAMKAEAEMLPRDFRRELRRFVTFDESPRGRAVPPFDYRRYLGQFSEALDTETGTVSPQLLEKIADGFRPEDSDLAAGYGACVARVLPYLQGLMPVRTELTVAKTYSFDPSDTEIAAFRRAFDVANDPRVILRDMAGGTLIPDQVGHFAACYPDMYSATKTMLGLAMADALAAKKSWRLPWKKELMVQCLFQTDTFTPGMLADLQSRFAKPPSKPQAPQSAPSKATGKIASMFQPATSATADMDLAKG